MVDPQAMDASADVDMIDFSTFVATVSSLAAVLAGAYLAESPPTCSPIPKPSPPHLQVNPVSVPHPAGLSAVLSACPYLFHLGGRSRSTPYATSEPVATSRRW